MKSFAEVHQRLKAYFPSESRHGRAYTLERMQQLMASLGDPQNSYKVIHVGGTSGKTSTAYYIASLLHQSGVKVGLSVSPHVEELNERVQIDMQLLPEREYCRQFTKFINLVEKSGVYPTYFELLVAFAFWQFAESSVNYAVIEVGLGGLLDATNVVKSNYKVCVITDIGLDHTKVLGKSIEEIAAQKAGIIHPYNTVFMYLQDDSAMTVFREVCEQQQAELHEILPKHGSSVVSHLPLFQQRNWHLAGHVFSYVQGRDNLRALLTAERKQASQIKIPARMEIIKLKNGKTLIIDGAHNAQKVSALVKSVLHRFPDTQVAVLFSLVHTKNARVHPTLKELLKLNALTIVTAFGDDRDAPKYSIAPEKLAENFHILGYDNWELIPRPEDAFNALLKRPEPVLLVTGSFYLLNHIRPLIK